MIHVIAEIEVTDGAVKEFLEIFKANVPAVLSEDGCREYGPTVDIDTGLPVQDLCTTRVAILEKWDSVDCLMAHLKTPHMLDYREKVKDLVVSTNIKVLQAA